MEVKILLQDVTTQESQPLERPRTDRHGPVHGHPRRRDRQRRAARRSRPISASRRTNLQWVISAYAILFGGTLLLGGRLADLLGRRRMFVAGLGAVRGELAALRARLVGGLADRVPRAAGPRRRVARAGRAFAADDDVRRGTRAEHGARDLRRGVGERRSGGRPARRAAHLVPELVVDLLHQRSGRCRGDRADAVPAPREPGRPRSTATSTSPARPRSRPG